MTIVLTPPPTLQGEILVVDDDLGMQDTLCDILRTTGVTANAATTAQDAVTWCEEHAPDLVILDQMLPDASGLQLAALLKARLPQLPIVLLTGHASAESAIAAVGLVDDYLTKPVPPNQLMKVVQTGLEQHRLRTINKELLEELQRANLRLELTVQERTSELRLARDRAMEASRLKSQFLANMSHEIRTPMNAVVGFAELLSHTSLTEEQRQYVDLLIGSGRSLLGIINDVLDFSKVEAGRLELEPGPFDLGKLVEEVSTLLAGQALTKGLQLVVDVDPRLPATFVADDVRVRQVITNLVGNAVKFTDSGHVIVRLDELSRDENQVVARFSVSDSGIGIADEDVPKLFDEFTQLDAAETRRFGGTGLGLAISDRLVRLMGGEIGCMPNPEGGSTFWFTLPSRVVPTEPPAQVAQGLGVLVAVRHPALFFSLGRKLSAWGATVVEASDAGKAVAQLVQAREVGRPFDLVIAEEALGSLPSGDEPLVLLGPGPAERVVSGALRLQEPVSTVALAGIVAAAAGRDRDAGPVAIANLDLPGAQRNTTRVLVVEDNAVNSLILSRMLSLLGCPADIATSGAEALAETERNRYTAVLMDCQMPVMDGLETTRRIRAREGDAARVPIVAVTATATTDDEARCRAAGMDDYIAKPITLDRLRAALQPWLPG